MATAHYSCGCWRATCCRPAAGKSGSHCGKPRNRCNFPKGTPVPAKGKTGPKPGTTPNVSPVTRSRLGKIGRDTAARKPRDAKGRFRRNKNKNGDSNGS